MPLKVPHETLDLEAFYLRQLGKVSEDPNYPWYSCAPIGKNMLRKMLPTMCEEAGIGRRTNHSLRATGATELFHANILEEVIQCRTGHRLLKAL